MNEETTTNTAEQTMIIEEPLTIVHENETIFQSGEGIIKVVHDITLGDLIISTLLLALLITFVLDKVFRR